MFHIRLSNLVYHYPPSEKEKTENNGQQSLILPTSSFSSPCSQPNKEQELGENKGSNESKDGLTNEDWNEDRFLHMKQYLLPGIFKLAIFRNNSLEFNSLDFKLFNTIRRVCKLFKRIIDFVMPNYIAEALKFSLQKTSFFLTQELRGKVDALFIKDQNTDIKCEEKTGRLQSALAVSKEIKDQIKDQIKDRELEIFWAAIKPTIQSWIAGYDQKLPTKAKEIREWMSKNSEALQSINYLDINLLNGDKQLNTLPEEIAYFTGLTRLKINNTQISTLPSGLKQLPYLEMLDLSGNQIQDLPSWIGTLTNLKRLNLSHNQIQTLPGEIGTLKSLKRLDLSSNQMKTLPNEIQKCQKLEVLDLSDNKITDFHALVAKLRDTVQPLVFLRALHLESNQIEKVQQSLLDDLFKGPYCLDENRWLFEDFSFLNLCFNPIQKSDLEGIENKIPQLLSPLVGLRQILI